MARAALTNAGFKCLFANDFDAKKVESYTLNWGEGEIRLGDIRKIETSSLPQTADLVWASFPCQDLSLAGGGAGLRGNRSGTFWPFWKLVQDLKGEGRAPTTVVLENVCGTLTSHGGKDFEAICTALTEEGYLVGALVMDAVNFVPQSRPRLFVVGTLQSKTCMQSKIASTPQGPWHTKTLISAVDKLPEEVRRSWVWWHVPAPEPRVKNFSDIVETSAPNEGWHSSEETEKLLSMMSPLHIAKIEAAKKSGMLKVGTLYRRTRQEGAERVQRAEVRFDEIAGCLRTPAGGSSRQVLIFVHGDIVRTRLITSRETARLMGLPDTYKLPLRYNEAYHLTGDGVAVPVVEHLGKHLLLSTLSTDPEALVA
jgi:DNA (cytosine-5)-methyltransferase 1